MNGAEGSAAVQPVDKRKRRGSKACQQRVPVGSGWSFPNSTVVVTFLLHFPRMNFTFGRVGADITAIKSNKNETCVLRGPLIKKNRKKKKHLKAENGHKSRKGLMH